MLTWSMTTREQRLELAGDGAEGGADIGDN
jgi:hypothetical protein